MKQTGHLINSIIIHTRITLFHSAAVDLVKSFLLAGEIDQALGRAAVPQTDGTVPGRGHHVPSHPNHVHRQHPAPVRTRQRSVGINVC